VAAIDKTLRVLEVLEAWTERILGTLLRATAGALTRLLRRGRHRNWRREQEERRTGSSPHS
jgi:hypothetical protein